jgi:16S rRNA (adenine1518-N6/adenine1519-N6)-dimethyltransferase
LLAAGVRQLVAIERDERCLSALSEVAAAHPGRVELIAGNALEIDLAAISQAPRKIIANLPYNVATKLLLQWLDQIREYQSLTLMFQREVAERLIAKPRSKSYGRLSVLVQWVADPRIVFHVPARAFVPPPTVTSSVVSIVPRIEPLARAEKRALERVTAAAFGQRRKMLRNSLRSLGVAMDHLLARAGTDPAARAEELSVAEFCALARALEQSATSGGSTAENTGTAPSVSTSAKASQPRSARPVRGSGLASRSRS